MPPVLIWHKNLVIDLLTGAIMVHFVSTRELFEVNFYGLVKKMVLQALVRKILQSEKPGGISLVYRYFKVVCRVENSQLFSLWHVGI